MGPEEPMNLIGPELVRDLVTAIGELESDENVRPGVRALQLLPTGQEVPYGRRGAEVC